MVAEAIASALPEGTPCRRRDSNPRQSDPQTGALPTELRPPNGVSEEIRTPDPRLRRALLYPAELQTCLLYTSRCV